MRKRIASVVALLALAFAGLVLGGASLASAPPQHKVTLCHATRSASNPYVEITVDVASAGVAADLHGHRGHADDIIPTFTYDGVTYAGQGDQSILANGCKVAQTTSTTTSTTTTTPTTTETTPSTTTTPTDTTTSTGQTTTAGTTTSSTSTTPTTTVPSSTSTSTSTAPITTSGSSTSTSGISTVAGTTSGQPTSSTTTTTAAAGLNRQPPTRKQLQRQLRKQAARPGTGRTSGPNTPGDLPNTGLPLWAYALIGAGVLLLGFLLVLIPGLMKVMSMELPRHLDDQ